MKTTTDETNGPFNYGLSGQDQIKKAQEDYGYEGPELREYLRTLFMERNVIEDTKWFNEIFDFWFHRAHSRPAATNTRKNYGEERNRLADKLRKQLEERDDTIRVNAQIDLLSMIMSNGKPLGDCTFYEVELMAGVFGPFLERLAKRGLPGQQVKTVLTEAQVRALWDNSGLNSRSSAQRSAHRG